MRKKSLRCQSMKKTKFLSDNESLINNRSVCIYNYLEEIFENLGRRYKGRELNFARQIAARLYENRGNAPTTP